MSLYLIDIGEDTVTGPEADNDLGDTKEEGLDPVFHEFAVEIFHVLCPPDFSRCFELDPVDRAALLWRFGVPYCVKRFQHMRTIERVKT